MTALLSTNKIDTARRLAKPKFTFAGTLSSGEAFYSDGRGSFAVEKDYQYLVEPTADELGEIDRFFFPYRNTRNEPDDLAPARGIMIGVLIGSALWLVIGLVIYFTFI